ncbi:MAG: DUF692 domain-containing protein [Acidobacteriota bacterium]|nr:DUF692 domain-containing protein [Acidobacteriota bacterium]
MESLPKLGVGVGFREIYRAETFLHRAEIEFLEITADHYLDAPPKKLAELDLLADNFALIPHGLNLSLGSAEGIDEKYLEKLAVLIDKIQPAWWSEHICFTRADGTQIGHLAPLPFTAEAVETLIRNIAIVKSVIKTPLILENITYNVRFPSSEFDEAEFVNIIAEETDCGLLLDVTNLYINSKNHNYDWRAFLDRLPTDRIVQLHFVGSHRHENRLIDAHANRTENEIWEVFSEVCRRSEVKGAILERDENFPPFDEILDELKIARSLLETENSKQAAFV